MLVRPRVDADIDAVVGVALRVQDHDGYPGRRPRDMRTFLQAPDALGAWVAEVEDRVVGHAALHRDSLPVVMERAARFLGRPPAGLGVVARLIVDPSMRRSGAGRALLERAAEASWARGLHPILDVASHYDAARALYEACGWRNAGEVTMVFADGTALPSCVYVARSPRPPDGAAR